MKFPRNARIFRGQLDAAPFASVFFLLVIFVLLGKYLYTPGVQVKLPAVGDIALAGPTGPTVSVAVTTNAIYFADQSISESDLSTEFKNARQKASEPLTLVLQVDEDVTEKKWMRLWTLAQSAGITNLSVSTFPRAYDRAPVSESKP